MASYNNFTGWEDGNFDDTTVLAGTPVIESANPISGTYSVTCSGTNSGTARQFPVSGLNVAEDGTGVAKVRFRIRVNSAYPSAATPIAGFGDSGTRAVAEMNASGAVRVNVGTAQSPYSTEVLSLGTNYIIELDESITVNETPTPGASAVTGTVRIYNAAGTLLETTTATGGVAYLDYQLKSPFVGWSGAGSKTGNFTYDDWQARMNDSATVTLTATRTARVFAVLTTGNGTTAQWTGSYADVDEIPFNPADGNTQTEATLNEAHTYIHGSAKTLGFRDLEALKISALAMCGASQTHAVLIGSTEYASTWTGSYGVKVAVDFSSYTTAAFNALQYGVRNKTGTATTTLNAIMAQVLAVPTTSPTVTIASVDRSSLVGIKSTKLNLGLGSDWTCEFDVTDPDSTASAYRPAIRDDVIADDGSERVFHGKIVTVKDEPVLVPGTGTATHVTAKANAAITDQIYVTKTYAAGQTLKQVVTDLTTTYLNPLGITLDTGMLTGATLDPLVFDHVLLKDVFNKLTEITRWIWRVRPDDVLEMFAAGTKTAWYSLTAVNRLSRGAVTWEKTLGNYCNKITFYYGSGQGYSSENFTSNGTQTTYVTAYPGSNDINSNWPNRLILDGVYNQPVSWGDDPSFTWYWNWATHTLHNKGAALGAGIVVTIAYTTQYPAIATATHASYATDPWEKVYKDEQLFDSDTAQARADGLLLQGLAEPRTVIVDTREGFVLPGSTITLTFADRLVSGSHVIINVAAQAEGLIDVPFLRYTLTCLSGSETQPSWLEQFRAQLNGNSAQSSVAGSAGGSSGSVSFGVPIVSAVLATDTVALPAWTTNIPTAVTIGSAYIYRAGGADVPLLDGGTNASLVASVGGIVYSTATALAILAGTATAGKHVRSAASAAPTWSTATWPDTASTAGAYLRADGTNWITSTLVLPNAATQGDTVVATGANAWGAVAAVAAGSIFASNGLSTVPVWTATPSIATSLTVPTLYGSSAANGDLLLYPTSHATMTSSWISLAPTGGFVSIGAVGAQSTKLNIDDVNHTLASGDMTFSARSTSAFGVDVGPNFGFQGQYNTGGNYTTFGMFHARKENATDGNTDGYVDISVRGSGAQTVRHHISSTGAMRWSGYGAGTLTTDASGNITAVSDERIKDIQGPYARGLDALLGIRPIRFRYKALSKLETENTYVGFSAQNVLAYAPEAVSKGLDGYYGLSTTVLLALAVISIQELTREIDGLRAALNLPPKRRGTLPLTGEAGIVDSATPIRIDDWLRAAEAQVSGGTKRYDAYLARKAIDPQSVETAPQTPEMPIAPVWLAERLAVQGRAPDLRAVETKLAEWKTTIGMSI